MCRKKCESSLAFSIQPFASQLVWKMWRILSKIWSNRSKKLSNKRQTVGARVGVDYVIDLIMDITCSVKDVRLKSIYSWRIEQKLIKLIQIK